MLTKGGACSPHLFCLSTKGCVPIHPTLNQLGAHRALHGLVELTDYSEYGKKELVQNSGQGCCWEQKGDEERRGSDSASGNSEQLDWLSLSLVGILSFPCWSSATLRGLLEY